MLAGSVLTEVPDGSELAVCRGLLFLGQALAWAAARHKLAAQGRLVTHVTLSTVSSIAAMWLMG